MCDFLFLIQSVGEKKNEKKELTLIQTAIKKSKRSRRKKLFYNPGGVASAPFGRDLLFGLGLFDRFRRGFDFVSRAGGEREDENWGVFRFCDSAEASCLAASSVNMA